MDDQEMVKDGLMRISKAAKFLDISRSMMYQLLNSGEMRSVKIGRSRRIPIRFLYEFAEKRLEKLTTE